MEELICNECKGRKFRKISDTEYECEYCGAIIKEDAKQETPQVVIVQQPIEPQVIVTPFPNEVSYSASCKDGSAWVGGKLVINPDIFSFIPHSFNFSGNLSPREWNITDIVEYVKGKLSCLDIKMKDGSKVKLSCNDRDKIIYQLEERRKYWVGKAADNGKVEKAEVKSSISGIVINLIIAFFALLCVFGWISMCS